MTINPSDIQLSEEHKQRLAKVAEQNGQPWEDVVDAMLHQLEHAKLASQSNGATKSDQEREQAFLEAAGGWADMDVDTWLEDIYEQRQQSSSPPPEL
jgi:predicted HD phosphohydrolase